jgi:hypothetical protein
MKFQPKQTGLVTDEILRLKDMLIEEKDKRIQSLEETISILMEAQAAYVTKKKG